MMEIVSLQEEREKERQKWNAVHTRICKLEKRVIELEETIYEKCKKLLFGSI